MRSIISSPSITGVAPIRRPVVAPPRPVDVGTVRMTLLPETELALAGHAVLGLDVAEHHRSCELLYLEFPVLADHREITPEGWSQESRDEKPSYRFLPFRLPMHRQPDWSWLLWHQWVIWFFLKPVFRQDSARWRSAARLDRAHTMLLLLKDQGLQLI